MSEETVPLKYGGPSAKPISIAGVTGYVRREDSPATTVTDPDTGEEVEVADTIEVPADLAVRLVAQDIWEAADRGSRRKLDRLREDEPDEAEPEPEPADEPGHSAGMNDESQE